MFERADRIGGLLRYGIPEFKMEKRFIDRRLEQMQIEGTVFRTNVNVGVDVTVDELREDFDAVVLAVGSTIGRDLPIPGRELDGIHQAMEFLPQANRVQHGDTVPGQIVATGKKVVIIGGGDTGADCLGTSLRQGAESVHQFEIMPRPPMERAGSTPWPTYPLMYRVSSAHEEGGDRVFSVNTEEFTGENGKVTALKAHEVKMVAGRFEKVEGPTSPSKPTWFCWRWVSSAPNARTCSTSSALPGANAESSSATVTSPRPSWACSSPATPDAASR